MKKTYLFFIFNLFHLTIFSQNITVEEFQKQIAESGLQFEMPVGYTIKEVKKNRDLQYSFAIINTEGTMEVRYSVFPMKETLIEYEKSKNDPNVIMINPNKLYIGIMQSNGLNMTNGKMVDIGDFPPSAVKKEFNADYGGNAFFEFKVLKF